MTGIDRAFPTTRAQARARAEARNTTPFTAALMAAALALGLMAALFAPREGRADALLVQAAPDAAITTVIDTQLSAFRAGDRQRAYAQAAPFIQKKFPNAGIFMEMVSRGYTPLIAPKATDFLPPEPLGDGRVRQPMALLDSKGQGWIAHYLMERQPDGSWKIAGCRLEKAPDAAA